MCLGFNDVFVGKSDSLTLEVEHDKLCLEENIAKNGKADAFGALDTTVAKGGGETTVVDVVSRNLAAVVAKAKVKAGQVGCAREDPDTVVLMNIRALDLAVVELDQIIGQQKQSGTGVNNGRVVVLVPRRALSNSETLDVYLPPGTVLLHLGEANGSIVLALVDVAEVVVPSFALL
ncbi:hypothetical protein HG530_003854 [Fusarium avenaceum]|nr:hypothetical protein HG530_003854 [Fusarium avenaceum]